MPMLNIKAKLDGHVPALACLCPLAMPLMQTHKRKINIYSVVDTPFNNYYYYAYIQLYGVLLYCKLILYANCMKRLGKNGQS